MGLKPRELELNNNRQGNGARSALNNYPNTATNAHSQSSTSYKQINRNKIEKDPITEAMNNQQFQNGNSQQQKSLTKTQSQNRLHLVSPDSLMSKGQDFNQVSSKVQPSDKLSFFKDQLPANRQAFTQDLLFKHHQYSSTAGQQTSKGGTYQLKGNSTNLILSHLSTKECTYCNRTQGGGMSQSIMPCSAILCSHNQLGLMIQNDLSKKYSTNRDYYNVKIVNDLIYNENTHIVSIFKDYLILDDINEFLKRTYTVAETKVRLPKLCSFYDKYSQVFPNYVVLPESKYMFKNIQRKQKLIDEQYQLQEELAKKVHQSIQDEDRLFNSKFYNSVYKLNDLSMSIHQYEDQAKTIAGQAGKKINPGGRGPFGYRIEDMKIDELVDRFLMKDSESNIQLQTMTGINISGFSQSSMILGSMNEKTPPKGMGSKAISTAAGYNKQSAMQLQGNKGVKNYTSKPVGARATQQTDSTKKNSVHSGNGTASGASTKRQKQSFNMQSSKQAASVVPRLDTGKVAMANMNGSTKNTPRIQKPTGLVVNDGDGMKQQTSPATKEALQNYLQQCQIDLNADPSANIQILESVMDSPSIHSPHINQKKLTQSNGQFTVHQLGSSSSQQNHQRHMIKSQCIVPTVSLGQQQVITNLKKSTTRLSSGPNNQLKQVNKKQTTSPMPHTIVQNVNLQQQSNQLQASRNMQTSSTQKSLKAVNSHAKYLSGGNEQYQKLLAMQQNSYATHDTINSNHASSSAKKIIYQSRAKQVENIQEVTDNNEILTGEDCCDDGIADERFASPDVFNTADDRFRGRNSIESRGPNNLTGNPMLLTSSDDKMLNQFSNYDQIKKHLEQYITVNNQNTFDTNNTQNSNSKQFSLAKGNIEKMGGFDSSQDQQHFVHGYNKQHLAQSAGGTIQSTDVNGSRNGTAQKHFESLKQKIRGVFEQNDTSQNTPNKTSQMSKKSSLLQAQNRMSIEAKDMGLNNMVPSSSNQGYLSSTAANCRTLSFNQPNNSQNYRSITNIQQRKGSNGRPQETSIEAKRLSQNRQSFKEASSEMQQKKIKRCATGKTLSINDVNIHTFGMNPQTGYINSLTNPGTLVNPTFISSTSSQTQKIFQGQNPQNPSQAANTVRVLTPSYSLASLSKLITPTQQTSPMTMTVTLAGSSQSRKQLGTSNSKKHLHPQSHHQHNPSGTLIASSSHQNFLIADKNSKLISKNPSSSQPQNISLSRSTKVQKQIQGIQTISNQKKGQQQFLVQSNSLQNFQVTPRGGNLIPQDGAQRQKQGYPYQLAENSQNMSCTVSTENNSTAKAFESKHPKFMRTIEEHSSSSQGLSYNNMLSASMGNRKPGGMVNSVSQAQYDLKQKHKIQTVVSTNSQAFIKRSGAASGATLSSSASVQNFRSPNQMQAKKTKYM